MREESLTTLSSILSQKFNDAFPEWAQYIEMVKSEGGDNAQCFGVSIPSPIDGRYISIRERGDCIEVCFSDGRQPGGAERLHICERGEEMQCVEASIQLMKEIVDEKLVIVRERSSPLLGGVALPPTFVSSNEISRRKRLVSVVSWRGKYDEKFDR